jgi:hypothetical protein
MLVWPLPVLGFGHGARIQLVPSQCSKSVLWTFEPLEAKYEPNAQMSVGETAVMPNNRLD